MQDMLNFVLCCKAVPHFLYDELGKIVLYSGTYSKLCLVWAFRVYMIEWQFLLLCGPFTCL